jgi:hypothetical protein
MSSGSFILYDSLSGLWNNNNPVAQVGQGDTLVLYGLQLEIGSNNELTFNEVRLWGGSGLAAGSYTYGGVEYLLQQDVNATTKPPDDEDPSDEDPPDDPDPSDEDPPDDTTTTPPATSGDSTVGNKSGGSLTVTTPTTSSTKSNTSGTSSGSLTVSPFSVEDGSNTATFTGDEEPASIGDTDTPLDWSFSTPESDGEATGQQTSTDPRTAAGIIGSAVSALGGSLWFALRRLKNPITALVEV